MLYWLVLYPNGKIYYEGSSKEDCEVNCPDELTYKIVGLTEEGFADLFPHRKPVIS